jgi:hypothetical protein
LLLGGVIGYWLGGQAGSMSAAGELPSLDRPTAGLELVRRALRSLPFSPIIELLNDLLRQFDAGMDLAALLWHPSQWADGTRFQYVLDVTGDPSVRDFVKAGTSDRFPDDSGWIEAYRQSGTPLTEVIEREERIWNSHRKARQLNLLGLRTFLEEKDRHAEDLQQLVRQKCGVSLDLLVFPFPQLIVNTYQQPRFRALADAMAGRGARWLSRRSHGIGECGL